MFFSSCTAERLAVQLLANFEIGKLFLHGYLAYKLKKRIFNVKAHTALALPARQVSAEEHRLAKTAHNLYMSLLFYEGAGNADVAKKSRKFFFVPLRPCVKPI